MRNIFRNTVMMDLMKGESARSKRNTCMRIPEGKCSFRWQFMNYNLLRRRGQWSEMLRKPQPSQYVLCKELPIATQSLRVISAHGGFNLFIEKDFCG
jgi:hypothetical protein